MHVLELFSGTASFSSAASLRGHSCTTIDNDQKMDPDICTDIMTMDISILKRPDIIWASPPCTCFSVASIHNRYAETKISFHREHQRCTQKTSLDTISYEDSYVLPLWRYTHETD
jgi:site-specific DNA-cytosine methylase